MLWQRQRKYKLYLCCSEAFKYTGPAPCYSPDGRYVACCQEQRVIVYEVDQLQVMLQTELRHSSEHIELCRVEALNRKVLNKSFPADGARYFLPRQGATRELVLQLALPPMSSPQSCPSLVPSKQGLVSLPCTLAWENLIFGFVEYCTRLFLYQS